MIPKGLFNSSDYKSHLKFLEFNAGNNQRELNKKRNEQYEIQNNINSIRDYEFNDVKGKDLAKKLFFKVIYLLIFFNIF